MTVTLRSPSGRVCEFTSERVAAVWRRKGWTDPTDTPNTPASEGPVRAPAIAGQTISDVLGWVDGDPDRARSAIDAEHHRPDGPRVTLVAQLEAIAEPQEE